MLSTELCWALCIQRRGEMKRPPREPCSGSDAHSPKRGSTRTAGDTFRLSCRARERSPLNTRSRDASSTAPMKISNQLREKGFSLRGVGAARARRDHVSMRTGGGMVEERADLSDRAVRHERVEP